MSGYFSYNTSGNTRVSGPIFPDFDHRSKVSMKMMAAKAAEDENYWPTMREVFAHDFNTLPKDRFKVWASVMSVPFINRSRYLEYTALCTKAVLDSEVYAKALKEPMVGCDRQDFLEHLSAFDDFQTTHNRILCMGHLISCGYGPEELSKMNTIIEFGAGIGELCDIVYKLGFKGEYIIYDFPEVGAIQKWYHDQLGYNKVKHTSDLEDLHDADLCIGTWSLTEMPIDLREKILAKTKNSKNWLVAYSNNIFGLDNNKWINNTFIPTCGQSHTVEFKDIKSMPWHGGAKYVTLKTK